jgi:hypothetical protein
MNVSLSIRINGERAENGEEAISCFRAALAMFTQESSQPRWPNEFLRFYLKNCIEGDWDDSFDEANAIYKDARQIFVHDEFPSYSPEVTNDLGSAWQHRIRGANVDMALECYQNAVQVRTR